MPGNDLRVAVVGGGIGGLCLAQGLRKAGVQVAVYERDPEPPARLDRYRLHIDPAGARALHACLPEHAWNRFQTVAGRSGGGFGFLDTQLRELVVIEDAVMYPGQEDPVQRARPVDRGALRDVLLSGLDDVVRFGRRFERYEPQPGGGVTARFADGSRTEADLLVGADGAGSRVRAQLLPDARRVDTGTVGIGLKLALGPHAWVPERLTHGENMIMSGSPFFLFTSVFEPGEPVSPGEDGSYLLCAFVARRAVCPPDLRDRDGAGLQQMVGDLIGRWHPLLRRLIAAADPDSVGLFPFAASAPPAEWEAGPVTVLGDAIHLMPPTGGIGANTALRDAHLLTRRLAAAAAGRMSVVEAVAGYEVEMRDYGFAAVRAALTTLRQGLSTNALQHAGMHAFFRLCRAMGPVRRVCFRDTWAAPCRPRPWERTTALV